MSQAPSSWSWKVRGHGVIAAADVIRTACPPGDDVAKLTPFQAAKSDDAGEGGTTRIVYTYLPPRLCSALLAPYSPHGHSNVDDISLRVILALHGYSGRPLQEIRKWHDAAVALDAVILAPQGTPTPSDGNNLGWNAVDCCGDPARDGIDDLDFVIHGAVEAFLEVLGRDGTGDPEKGRSGDNQRQRGNVPVIATGFSNGGFLSSLLGLLPPSRRPPWLAGVVPTGGYQYDAALYEGPVRPLPAMSHHGGRDSIVRPEGCCVGGSDDGDGAEGGESNCFQDIGAKRDACLPVLSAFEMWSHINGCTATILDEDAPDKRRRAKKVDKDREPIVTCWKGVDCIEPTNFCMWNNEGHAWGFEFPGIQMAQAWMEEVFRSSEARFEEDAIDVDRGDDVFISYAPAISYDKRSRKGEIILSAAVVFLGLLGLCVACRARSSRRPVGGGAKRKTSEEERDSDDEGDVALVAS